MLGISPGARPYIGHWGLGEGPAQGRKWLCSCGSFFVGPVLFLIWALLKLTRFRGSSLWFGDARNTEL